MGLATRMMHFVLHHTQSLMRAGVEKGVEFDDNSGWRGFCGQYLLACCPHALQQVHNQLSDKAQPLMQNEDYMALMYVA